jgi:predicted house-cleaning noncanonical NTP pyrophosphatase (MazG superfamily)
MKIIFETSYNRCEVSDDNVENSYETMDLVVQALRGFGFSDENIADALLQKSQEMNQDKIILVV